MCMWVCVISFCCCFGSMAFFVCLGTDTGTHMTIMNVSYTQAPVASLPIPLLPLAQPFVNIWKIKSFSRFPVLPNQWVPIGFGSMNIGFFWCAFPADHLCINCMPLSSLRSVLCVWFDLSFSIYPNVRRNCSICPRHSHSMKWRKEPRRRRRRRRWWCCWWPI